MVELHTAERRELLIIELPTELQRPRIGSADVGVAAEFVRAKNDGEFAEGDDIPAV